MQRPETINLEDYSRKTNTQEFIEIYNKLKAEGALDEENIIEVGRSMLEDKLKARREEAIARNEARAAEANEAHASTTSKTTQSPKRIEIAKILANQ